MNNRIGRKFLVMAVLLVAQNFAMPVLQASAETFRFMGKEWKTGEIIKYGKYLQEQDGNKKSPIAWEILAVENDKALLLSEKCLDVQPYHGDPQAENVTWEKCTLRDWLNRVFWSDAFSEKEQKRILETKLKETVNEAFDTDGGPQTSDHVFLLSLEETEQYMGDRSGRIAFPSEWLEEKNPDIYISEVSDAVFWWLRTPGDNLENVACVGAEGSLVESGYPFFRLDFGVRPAMWVKADDQ